MCGKKRARIEIDRMAARRLHDRHALARDVVAQVRRRRDAIAQVVLFEHFLNADGDRFQVAPGQAAIGRIAFGQDQQIFFLLREQIVVGAEKAADVRHAVLLRRHGAAVAQPKHLLRDLFGRFRRRSPARAA